MIPFDRRDLRASHDASSYMSFEQSVASRYVAMRSEFNLIADTFEWVGFGVHLCDGVIWRVFRWLYPRMVWKCKQYMGIPEYCSVISNTISSYSKGSIPSRSKHKWIYNWILMPFRHPKPLMGGRGVAKQTQPFADANNHVSTKTHSIWGPKSHCQGRFVLDDTTRHVSSLSRLEYYVFFLYLDFPVCICLCGLFELSIVWIIQS